MGDTMDKLLQQAEKVADGAIRMTSTLVNKGKEQVDKATLHTRLAKLYRQLGSLVYTQRKSGQENEAMVSWYVGEIDSIKEKLAQLVPPEEDSVVVFSGDKNGEEAGEDGAQGNAMFRGGDSEESPK